MSKFVGRSVAGVMLVAASTMLAPVGSATERVYVPCFKAVYWSGGPGLNDEKYWYSQVHAFNNGSEVAIVKRTGIYVPIGYSPSFVPGEAHYAPGEGGRMPYAAGDVAFFNEFEVPASVAVSAEVEKTQFHFCGFADSGLNPVTAVLGQGRVPLPVYRGLFPSGTSVVTNTIALGNPRLDSRCASEAEKYLRRVNVTLFNAGEAPGTFSIKVLPLWNSSTPVYQASVTLAAKEVRQLNRLPIPVIDTPASYETTGVLVWMVVTCDQPFLGYASTIFDDPEPGAQPFEVFAFKKGS